MFLQAVAPGMHIAGLHCGIPVADSSQTLVMHVESTESPVFAHVQVSVSSDCFTHVCSDLPSALHWVAIGRHSRHSPWVHVPWPAQVTVRSALPSSRQTEICV